MNRRTFLQGLLGATTLSAVPVAIIAAEAAITPATVAPKYYCFKVTFPPLRKGEYLRTKEIVWTVVPTDAALAA